MISTAAIFSTWLVLWLILIIAVAFSSLYSGTETGIYVLNKIRLDLRAEGGSRSAKLLRDMLRNPNNLLVVIMIGNNLVNYTISFVVSTMFLLAGKEGSAEWFTMAILTPVMFILCDSVPKNVMQRLGDVVVYKLAWLLWISDRLFNMLGLAWGIKKIVALSMRLLGHRDDRPLLGHEGLGAIVAEGQASGVLTHTQVVMADRIMHFAGVKLVNVMIPMAKVVKAPLGITKEQLIDTLRTQKYSRIPLVDESGSVAGILDIYDVIFEESQIVPSQKMYQPLLLPAQMNISEALYQMQRSRNMMAVVHNSTGKHIGIVTIKDIVEEIVGELEVL